LPHPFFGRTDESLAVPGPSALWKDRDAIDDGARNLDVSEDQRAWHDFGVAHDPPAESGYEPIGRIVLRMVDRGMKLGPRRGSRQSGKELENLALLTRSGRGYLAFREHPGRRDERHHRLVRNVMHGRPLGRPR
jgi:hypothetical protein